MLTKSKFKNKKYISFIRLFIKKGDKGIEKTGYSTRNRC